MYYKEEIIDGILCWKTYPEDSWRPLSQKELTERIVKMKEELLRRSAIDEPTEFDNPMTNPEGK